MDRVEMDQMIVENRGMSISEYLMSSVRHISEIREQHTYRASEEKADLVSCGGGVVMREETQII